jgi:upstream activation factor subunit UAF30
MFSLTSRSLVKLQNQVRSFAAKSKGTTPKNFQATFDLSPELTEIVGTDNATRQDALKGIWTYIKANNLQDPSNKRNIIADTNLEKVFGQPTATMFEIMKLMSPHIKK